MGWNSRTIKVKRVKDLDKNKLQMHQMESYLMFFFLFFFCVWRCDRRTRSVDESETDNIRSEININRNREKL